MFDFVTESEKGRWRYRYVHKQKEQIISYQDFHQDFLHGPHLSRCIVSGDSFEDHAGRYKGYISYI